MSRWLFPCRIEGKNKAARLLRICAYMFAIVVVGVQTLWVLMPTQYLAMATSFVMGIDFVVLGVGINLMYFLFRKHCQQLLKGGTSVHG